VHWETKRTGQPIAFQENIPVSGASGNWQNADGDIQLQPANDYLFSAWLEMYSPFLQRWVAVGLGVTNRPHKVN
jgi:hypothetical protein